MKIIIKKDGTKIMVSDEKFHLLWIDCASGQSKKYCYDKTNDILIEN